MIAIIGAGKLGTALSERLRFQGVSANLYGKDVELIDEFKSTPPQLVIIATRASDVTTVLKGLPVSNSFLVLVASNGIGLVKPQDHPLLRIGKMAIEFGVSQGKIVGLPRTRIATNAPEPSLEMLQKAFDVTEVVIGSAAPQDLEWKKGLVNLAINGACALAEKSNRALIDDPVVRRLAFTLTEEACLIGTKKGLPSQLDEAWNRTLDVAKNTADNFCSMLVDLQKGLTSEVDFLHGTISTWGKEYQISTPFHNEVAKLVRAIELTGGLSFFHPGLNSFDSLWDRSR